MKSKSVAPVEIMEFICRQPRVTGSEWNGKTREYLVEQYSQLGYRVEVQTVPFTGWELLEEPHVKFIQPVERQVEYCLPVVWSGSIDVNEVQGTLIRVDDIKTFEAYPWERYAVRDELDNDTAYLITRPDMVWGQPRDNWSDKVPYIIVDTEACRLINEWKEQGEQVVVSASVKSRYLPDQTLNNILVYRDGEKGSILVSCHYDSFLGTVGAHDNASGTAAVLSLASLTQSQEYNHVRFAVFDAEEWNKLGAYSYVEKLKREGALAELRLVINIDSVGVGEKIYILTSPMIEETVREIVSNLDVYQELEISVSSRDEFPQFDSWPFMKNGIPVMQIGTLADPPFRSFHHPDDTLENINPSIIDKVIRMVKGITMGYQV